MDIRKIVLDWDLRDGERKRLNCPACGGFNTLTASNDLGFVVYNCYKLGCGTRGAVSGVMTAADIAKRLKHRANSRPTMELPTMEIPLSMVYPGNGNSLLNSFKDKWDLGDIPLMFDLKDKRAVFPIYHKGRMIDANGRSLSGAIPKWLRYTGKAVVYEYVVGEPNGSVVILEDVISAITVAKVSRGTTGMAILGTSLGPAHMEFISNYSSVIIALDPDAANKTIDFKRQVECWTGLPTKALRLGDDIKYKNEKDVMALKEALKW